MLRWLAHSRGIIAGLMFLGAATQGNSALAKEEVAAGVQMVTTPVSVRISAGNNDHGQFLIKGSKEPPTSGVRNWDSLLRGQGLSSENFTFSSTVLPRSAQKESLGDGMEVPEDLNLDPELIENSPVLQDWLQEIPDISDEIRNAPSFRTRLRVGYAQFPSSNQASGIHLGIEDVFLIAGTGLTASGSFNRSWNDARESFGAEVRYYLLPLGSYVNLTPTVGYRSLETPDYTTNGWDVGFRVMVIPSRGGGADISISQHWVAPGRDDEVSMTAISVGYAVTSRLRLGTDLEFQNSRAGQENRLGILLEWLM